MAFPDRRTVNILLTILLFAVVCGLIYSARHILLIFIFAILFTYLIDPVVEFLQRHSLIFRNLRGPVVVETYVAAILVLAAAGYALAPGAARHAGKLVDEVPVWVDGLSTGDLATNLGESYGWSDAQESRVKTFLILHREDIQDLVRGANHYLSNAAEVLVWLILIPLLAIFFLRDGETIKNFFIRVFLPADRRKEACAIADDLHRMLRGYIRAQVILCGLSFVFYAAVLLLFKFPHAIALAALGGVLEFIPALGWASTAAAILSIGMINHAHWAWMGLFLGLWRIVQDYYNAPHIMGRQLQIHPLAAIFAVLVGAEVGGIVGMYLAIPLVAALRVIWREYAHPEGAGQGCHDTEVSSKAPSRLAKSAIS